MSGKVPNKRSFRSDNLGVEVQVHALGKHRHLTLFVLYLLLLVSNPPI